jgi:hypothetical protein
MISIFFSKTMNYLIILIKFKVSRFLCRSVYLGTVIRQNKIGPSVTLDSFTIQRFV